MTDLPFHNHEAACKKWVTVRRWKNVWKCVLFLVTDIGYNLITKSYELRQVLQSSLATFWRLQAVIYLAQQIALLDGDFNASRHAVVQSLRSLNKPRSSSQTCTNVWLGRNDIKIWQSRLLVSLRACTYLFEAKASACSIPWTFMHSLLVLKLKLPGRIELIWRLFRKFGQTDTPMIHGYNIYLNVTSVRIFYGR